MKKYKLSLLFALPLLGAAAVTAAMVSTSCNKKADDAMAIYATIDGQTPTIMGNGFSLDPVDDTNSNRALLGFQTSNINIQSTDVTYEAIITNGVTDASCNVEKGGPTDLAGSIWLKYSIGANYQGPDVHIKVTAKANGVKSVPTKAYLRSPVGKNVLAFSGSINIAPGFRKYGQKAGDDTTYANVQDYFETNPTNKRVPQWEWDTNMGQPNSNIEFKTGLSWADSDLIEPNSPLLLTPHNFDTIIKDGVFDGLTVQTALFGDGTTQTVTSGLLKMVFKDDDNNLVIVCHLNSQFPWATNGVAVSDHNYDGVEELFNEAVPKNVDLYWDMIAQNPNSVNFKTKDNTSDTNINYIGKEISFGSPWIDDESDSK